ncbi:hypothetical protein CEXT_284811, partial [Caerostris extrusa]
LRIVVVASDPVSAGKVFANSPFNEETKWTNNRSIDSVQVLRNHYILLPLLQESIPEQETEDPELIGSPRD